MEYEQMELDTTLDIDRSLKDNVQTVAKFALGQIMEHNCPSSVKNAHEGYGIAADTHASLLQKMKTVKGDMDTMLKLLPEGDGATLKVVGSLYNSAVETAVEAIKLAAQSQRILNDLYYGEDKKTPLEEYLAEQEDDGADDGFEDAQDAEED